MPLKTLPPRLAPMPRRLRAEATSQPFYHTYEWHRFVARLIKERGRYCHDPLHNPAVPHLGKRVYADHIVEIKDGGAPLDPRNIMLRCGACHNRKTAAEAKRRAELSTTPYSKYQLQGGARGH